MTESLEDGVAMLDVRLRSHAGGLRLMGVSSSGVARVRFTGMCTGCPYRPLTMAHTIRPALMGLPGVRGVEAEGARISAEAEARLGALVPTRLRHSPSGSGPTGAPV